MTPSPQEPSSIENLWRVLNATEEVSPPDHDCPGGTRFCAKGGVMPGGGAPSSGTGLDTEVYAQARPAFGALSFAMSLAVLFGTVTTHLVSEEAIPATVTIRQVLLLGLSLAMFGLTRWPGLCPRTVARWGQAYQLSGALLIAIWAFGNGMPTPNPGGGPILPMMAAWLAVWIVIFPLVAPARPWKTVALALASASTVPLVLVFAHALEPELPPLSLTQLVLASTLFGAAAVVAIVSSFLVQGLSRGISEARHQLSSLQTYQLLEELGQGGMGEVWRAEHRLLKRPAAIKIVKPQRLEGATLEEREAVMTRFEREATTTASLRSPHTVDLYDFGRTEGGDFFYVMELLDGDTLEDLVEHHGPLPTERVVHLLEQACASLAEAHERGLVHRDLKPANLMACRLGLQHDFVKVLDFGLVATVRKSGSDPKLTGVDSILGTPAYMAPEQGRGEDADPRSDVYALGCVAYWLLTGSTVFTQTKAVPMILDHIGTPPIPPTKRIARLIEPELEDLIMACLAKDPADRPPSALELARRLRGVHLETPWTPERAAAWWGTHGDDHGEAQEVEAARAETLTGDAGLVDPELAPTLQLR